MGQRHTWRAALVAAAMVVGGACVPSAPGPLDPGPPAAGLRVMTYNLLGAQGDGSVFSEWAGWAARIDQAAPDVVVVQEAQAGDVGAIVTGTGGRYRVGAYGLWTCDAKGDPEGVAILVRSNLTTGASGVHTLGTSCVDPSMQRVLAWVDVDLAGGPLRVYGTHLTAGSGVAAQSRLAQIAEVRRVIAADDPAGSGRFVLAGDVNATPGSAGFAALLGAGAADGAPVLADAQAAVSPPAGNPAVCPTVAAGSAAHAALLADPAHVAACGYTAGWPKDDNPIACELLSLCSSWELRRDQTVRERIDVVLVAAGGPVGVESVRVPNRADPDWAAPGAEWFHLSDHLPVIAELTVA